MIDNRFNTLAHWDNPKGDRYAVALEIISAEMNISATGDTFPVIEILQTSIIDKRPMNVLRVSLAIISLRTFATTTLAYGC